MSETPDETPEDMGVQYYSGRKGPNRESMVHNYLPDKDEWSAKTILDLNDPARVAVLRNYDRLYPMCEHHQPIIDDFLDEFLRSRTSVAGESRGDYKDIFMAMFGRNKGDSKKSMLVDALSEGLDDDE